MKTSSRFPFSLAPLVAFVLVCVVGGIAAASPLTGTPGPEAAQLLAALGGPILFFSACIRGANRKASGFLGDILFHGALVAACFLVFCAITTVVGWSVQSCAPGRGYLPLFINALPVLLLTSAIGLLIGRFTGRVRIALALGLLFALIYALWLGIDWALDPSFRVFSHLSVLIEGDLIRGRNLTASAAAFRTATFLFALAFACIGLAMYPKETRVGLSRTQGPHPALWILALVFTLTAVVIHAQSKNAVLRSGDELREAYSLERRRDRLILHADPLALNRDQADALLAEGALWMTRLQERMGVIPQHDIHIFFHADKSVMAKWTGAENVHFALPGRHELHITRLEVPHPTLGHELAHALGSELTNGFFGVPTDFFVFPKPGVVEGMAMALTPELEAPYGMTLREKAAALTQEELAPPLNDLFKGYLSFLGFWKHAPSNAYTVSGALIEAIAAERGTAGLKALYQNGRLEDAFEKRSDLDAFLAKYQSEIAKVSLPSHAASFVKRYYSRQSILNETCDRDRESAAQQVRAEASRGEFDEALRLAKAAEGETLSGETLASLAAYALSLEDKERAFEFLKKRTTLDEKNPRIAAMAQEAFADFLTTEGQYQEAHSRYSNIDTSTSISHMQRLVFAKSALSELAKDGDQSAIAALDFLVSVQNKSDVGAALASLGEVKKNDDKGALWADYLLARQYLQRGDTTRGLSAMLGVWSKRDALPPSFVSEIENAIAMGHARRGDFKIAALGFEKLAKNANARSERVLYRDRLERVLRAQDAKDKKVGDVFRGDRHLLGLHAAGRL